LRLDDIATEQALTVIDEAADDSGGLLDALILDELLDERPAGVMPFVCGGDFLFRAAFDREEHAALDVHERRGHDEEVTRELEIILLLCAQDLEVLLRDLLNRDVVDIDLVLADQEQEQVQRAFEDIEANRQVGRR